MAKNKRRDTTQLRDGPVAASRIAAAVTQAHIAELITPSSHLVFYSEQWIKVSICVTSTIHWFYKLQTCFFILSSVSCAHWFGNISCLLHGLAGSDWFEKQNGALAGSTGNLHPNLSSGFAPLTPDYILTLNKLSQVHYTYLSSFVILD